MKRAIRIFLGTLAFLSLTPSALSAMNPNYDVYASQSTDGTYIYTSVLLDGYTEGCCIPPTVTHQPAAYNRLGGVGGWGYGQPDCWYCYLSYQNDQSILADGDTEYEFESQGQVDCSASGFGFFLSNLGEVWLSIHKTTYRYVGPPCHYQAFCPTSPHICGNDDAWTPPPCTSPYLITYFLKVRIGISSSCLDSLGFGRPSSVSEPCY